MNSTNLELFHLGSQVIMWRLIVQSQHVMREETVSIWPPWSPPAEKQEALWSPTDPPSAALPWWQQADRQLRSHEVLWRLLSRLHTGDNHVLKCRQAVYLPSSSSSSSSFSSLSDPRLGKIGSTSCNWPFAGTAAVQSRLATVTMASDAQTSLRRWLHV